MGLELNVGIHVFFSFIYAFFDKEAVDIANRRDFLPVMFKNLLGVVSVAYFEPTGTPDPIEAACTWLRTWKGTDIGLNLMPIGSFVQEAEFHCVFVFEVMDEADFNWVVHVFFKVVFEFLGSS